MVKKIPMAICYDFDGTLSPGNMQEYEFMDKLGVKAMWFWKKSLKFSKTQNADPILAYMRLMLEEAQYKGLPVTRDYFNKCGENVEFFPGVTDWFKRINNYGKKNRVEVSHYIISSGLKEMIEGTAIAKEFKCIFASSFMYNASNVAYWPANAVNYTGKTQYLFRINKGCCDINDNKIINQYIPEEDRAVPYKNMIYIGDGDTDIPCMKLVKLSGGHSIAVYNPRKKGRKNKAQKLIQEDRVNISANADYREGKLLDSYVKSIIDKLSNDYKVMKFEK